MVCDTLPLLLHYEKSIQRPGVFRTSIASPLPMTQAMSPPDHGTLGQILLAAPETPSKPALVPLIFSVLKVPA